MIDDKLYLKYLTEARDVITVPSDMERKYKTQFRSFMRPANSQHSKDMNQCRKQFKDSSQKKKCFIKVSLKNVQAIKALKGRHSSDCAKAKDKAECAKAFKLTFDSEIRDMLDSVRIWKEDL